MSSPSTSRSSVSSEDSETTNSASIAEYHFPPNGLWAEPEPGLEDLCLYQSGGHHPVHLEDRLGDKKQYRVINKLGTGGFGNVWLCRNVKCKPTEYVAVKILMAELSNDESNSREAKNIRRLQELAKVDADLEKYCLLPVDEFVIEGPNGTHQCFVYPVAGPSAGKFSIQVPNPTNTLRRVIRQAVEAMAGLHRHGVCHGDFRPGNVLLRLDGLNGLCEEDALRYFGLPYVCDIEVDEEYQDPGDSAPEYVVCPATPDDDHLASAANLCVIDYGEVFDPSSPPEGGLGIPLPYCAPEIVLERKCGYASDIWALAATMFEIRTGKRLFSLGLNEDDYYLDILVGTIGPMPEPWWSTTWADRRAYYRDEADADGRAVPADDAWPVYDSEIVRKMHGDILHSFLGPTGKWLDIPFPEKEKPIFKDLIKWMMKWKPEDRPSAEEVLKHPWFALDDEEDEKFKEKRIRIELSEDEETEDEEMEDESEYDPAEDDTESDGERDEKMSDADIEGVNRRENEPKSDHQRCSTDDNTKNKLETDKKSWAKSPADNPKDDQKDDQKDVDQQVPYQRVEQMEYQKDDEKEIPKVDSQVEKVKENLLVSEKAGLLKVAVDARFRGVAAWVKKALKWSRK